MRYRAFCQRWRRRMARKITPLNGGHSEVASGTESFKAPPSAQTTEPKDEWRETNGWRAVVAWVASRNDDLMSIIRAVMTAEAELEQVKLGHASQSRGLPLSPTIWRWNAR